MLQRDTIDGCVSVVDLDKAVKLNKRKYLRLLNATKPIDYVSKAQKYLNIVIVKIKNDMPYIRLADLQNPYYIIPRDNCPSWKEQKSQFRKPKSPSLPLPSKRVGLPGNEAEKLFPLIDILLHCIPPFQLLANGQLKRCLHHYGGTDVRTKMDLVDYCREATKLCNICVHLIWGGGYCVALREPERPFRDDSINKLYFARRLPARFNADEITAKALRR